MGNSETLSERNKKYTLTTWKAQKDWSPINMVRAEGVYFWDDAGKRYLDWSSQLFNLNIGHKNQHVIAAIKRQVDDLSYAYPAIQPKRGQNLGKNYPRSPRRT